MTLDPSHEVFSRMSALYALGGLDGSERDLFERHLEICRRCVDEVSSFLPVGRALVFAAPPQPSPSRQLEDVNEAQTPDADLALRTQSVQPPPRHKQAIRPPRSQRGLSAGIRLMAGVCLLLAGAFGWYAARQVNHARDLQAQLDAAGLREQVADLDAATSRQLTEELRARADTLAAGDVETVALEGQPGAEAASGRAFFSATNDVVIAASGLPSLPPGQIYQVWLVLPDDPVSVGLARADSRGRLLESVAPVPEATDLIAVAVTMEPEGGGETPSENIVLLGRPDR